MSSRKEEIINTAIKLFNEKSCLKTTTRHICEDLGISVGNLYYYFKGKEEIIICIYENFMKELALSFDLVSKEKDKAFDFYEFLDTQMNFEYKYRFLRLEMINLISLYPQIKKSFELGVNIKMQQLKNLYKHQIKFAYMKELDEDELSFIISNSWIIVSQWEIFWLLNKVEDEKNRRKKGILNLLYFLKPYLSEKGLKETKILDSINFLKKDKNESK